MIIIFYIIIKGKLIGQLIGQLRIPFSLWHSNDGVGRWGVPVLTRHKTDKPSALQNRADFTYVLLRCAQSIADHSRWAAYRHGPVLRIGPVEQEEVELTLARCECLYLIRSPEVGV